VLLVELLQLEGARTLLAGVVEFCAGGRHLEIGRSAASLFASLNSTCGGKKGFFKF
jgi:hypothetical protein